MMELRKATRLAEEWRIMWDEDRFPRNKPMSVDEMDRRKVAHSRVRDHWEIVGPKLLKALKNLSPICYNDGPLPKVYHEEGIAAEKAIEEAEEVEGL